MTPIAERENQLQHVSYLLYVHCAAGESLAKHSIDAAYILINFKSCKITEEKHWKSATEDDIYLFIFVLFCSTWNFFMIINELHIACISTKRFFNEIHQDKSFDCNMSSFLKKKKKNILSN